MGRRSAVVAPTVRGLRPSEGGAQEGASHLGTGVSVAAPDGTNHGAVVSKRPELAQGAL